MPAILDTVTGATHYTAPYSLTDVLLDDVPVLVLQPIEFTVYPDGWGQIVFLNDPETGLPKKWVDGQQRNYTRRGRITVIP
jgi:hypothetical protein